MTGGDVWGRVESVGRNLGTLIDLRAEKGGGGGVSSPPEVARPLAGGGCGVVEKGGPEGVAGRARAIVNSGMGVKQARGKLRTVVRREKKPEGGRGASKPGKKWKGGKRPGKKLPGKGKAIRYIQRGGG